MSKEAEILTTCISCHDTRLCQKSSKSRGVMYLRCVSLTKSDSKAFSLEGNFMLYLRNYPTVVKQKINLLTKDSIKIQEETTFIPFISIYGIVAMIMIERLVSICEPRESPAL